MRSLSRGSSRQAVIAGRPGPGSASQEAGVRTHLRHIEPFGPDIVGMRKKRSPMAISPAIVAAFAPPLRPTGSFLQRELIIGRLSPALALCGADGLNRNTAQETLDPIVCACLPHCRCSSRRVRRPPSRVLPVPRVIGVPDQGRVWHRRCDARPL